MSRAGKGGFLLCDVGDVLFYDFPARLAYSWQLRVELQRLGEPADLGPWEILDARGHWDGAARRVPEPAWREANHLSWHHVLTCWNDLFVPIPGARETLARLGMKTAIVANQPAESLVLLSHHQIAGLVDAIVLDVHHGVSKPDPRLFEIALEALGAAAAETVMVGDRLDNDIVPARSMGMDAVWIEPFAYASAINVPGIPDAWRHRYEQERTRRVCREHMACAALPPQHRPSSRASSLMQLAAEWRA